MRFIKLFINENSHWIYIPSVLTLKRYSGQKYSYLLNVSKEIESEEAKLVTKSHVFNDRFLVLVFKQGFSFWFLLAYGKLL